MFQESDTDSDAGVTPVAAASSPIIPRLLTFAVPVQLSEFARDMPLIMQMVMLTCVCLAGVARMT